MLTRSELLKIAEARLKDAKVLFNSKRYDGGIYLCGYAVEVALKARICSTLRWNGYPMTSNEFKNFQSFKTLEGIMKKFIEKIAILEQSISAEKGDFVLFALFLREDAQDKWDLVVSAPWLEVNKKESLSYLTNELRSHLRPRGGHRPSTVNQAGVSKRAVGGEHKSFSVEHGKV